MRKILGFDISSQTIGFCALQLNDDGYISVITSGTYKPSQKGHILEKLDDVYLWAKNLIDKIQPTHIGIEDIAKFMAGKSTAQTIITLALFNRQVGLAALHFLKKPPELFNVLSIRSGIKLGERPQKLEIPSLIEKHLNIKFPYKYNKKKEILTESYDEADSYAVALFYSLILQGKKKKPLNKQEKLAKKRKVKTKKL